MIRFICPIDENTMQRRAEKERTNVMDLRIIPSCEVDLTLRKMKAMKTLTVVNRIVM